MYKVISAHAAGALSHDRLTCFAQVEAAPDADAVGGVLGGGALTRTERRLGAVRARRRPLQSRDRSESPNHTVGLAACQASDLILVHVRTLATHTHTKWPLQEAGKNGRISRFS